MTSLAWLPLAASTTALASGDSEAAGYHYSWVELLFDHQKNIFTEQFGASPDDAIRLVTLWGVCFFLIALGAVARLGLNSVRAKGGREQYFASTGLGFRSVFELYTEAIFNMIAGVLGNKDAKGFYWLLGGLFLFLFSCNLLSVVPGGLPPTDNMNTNLAISLVVLLVYVVAGVARTGFGFFKHMMGPVWWLAPLIFVIEAAGVFLIRPGSLTLRLFGNINGDHLVFGIMSDLVPVIVPSIFLGLGIWVSFLQAFVFTLLSAIYIMLSVDHGDDDH
jgi:F-type H+-transporting ATPase subunit a